MLNRLQHSKPFTITAIVGYALIPLCIIGYLIYANTGTKLPSPFAGWSVGETITETVDSESISSNDYSDIASADAPVAEEPSPQVVTASQPLPKPKNTKRPAQSNQTSPQHPQEKPKQEPIPVIPPSPEPVDNTPPVEPAPEPDPAPEPEPTPPIIPIDPPIIDPPATST